ncbi:hypothetical protein [Mycolicibacterium goodii]|uniref:Fatty acyl-AMP ligase FadD28 and polyketide synthase n=1 Tax=Mycolicibacterium goodii TaxID=134601 RepID=A0ABS6HFJ6_MYCGD|nr:hypothetical protein [Mycolicibacterium goodii]OKH75870.1 hypothetical protein EB74_14295 [Mycobacterium sp. SWH-M5]MBU8810547.1 hypothetical protein [Mycolicibacterium goodii]MBU8821432.1 hypothetical protein [Mycolicibacterium goodii]MBU8829909.1 hypothetical protein [Mycolicibacterium goodii]MBU8837739.1 hypothetical protein [Mycolicibacterium goodii]
MKLSTPPSTAAPDDRLSYTDQLLFLGQRATGQELVAQCVWVYEHPVDGDKLREFHRNFGNGLPGRRIERSPLPFGRHRWVASTGPASPLDIAEQPRPRAELGDWADERAQLPIDPEFGPGWHMGVLPMTDGSTAVSLVISHCLIDGLGTLQSIANTVKGETVDFGFAAPNSRGRLPAVLADARQLVRDLPETAATLVRACRLAIRRRHQVALSGKPRRDFGPDGGGDVVAPAIACYVPLEEWDRRAAMLGGNSHSLVAGFAAKLGELTGRRRGDDGKVLLHIPISDRLPGDTRGNAAYIVNAHLDPTGVTEDLSGARSAVRQALEAYRREPDETLQLLPLTPFIPQRAVARGSQVVLNLTDLPVSCSNLGDIDPLVSRIDGTAAEYLILRGVDRRVSREFLENRNGLLTVLAGRVDDKMSISVIAYQPGTPNDKPQLRELVAKALAEFDLVGTIA